MRYIPLGEFKKVYTEIMQKPGESTHSAKWDRCVEHVKSKGGANAYAVCTKMLGEESFKSIEVDSPNFIKELDEFMHTLGIAGAGKVPNSLLARQDLEGTEKIQKAYFMQTAPMDVIFHDPQKPQYTISENSDENGKYFKVEVGNRFWMGRNKPSIKIEQVKSGVMNEGWHVLVKALTAEIMDEKEGEEHYRDLADKFNEMADDEAGHKKELEGMGKASDSIGRGRNAILREVKQMMQEGASGDYIRRDIKSKYGLDDWEIDEMMGNYREKGAVESTGKQLDEALKDAPDADTRLERKSLVDNIKDIQIKRQEATITARQKNMKGKSFRDIWNSRK